MATSKNTIKGRKMAASARKRSPKNGRVTTAKAEVKTEVKVSRKARAVTFEIVKVNNRRTFKPINKRAKAFAELAKNNTLGVKQLKTIKKLGFRVLENSNGELAAISL